VNNEIKKEAPPPTDKSATDRKPNPREVLNELRQKVVVELLSLGFSRRTAARHVGVSHTSIARAAAWLLERRLPDEFGHRTPHSFSGDRVMTLRADVRQSSQEGGVRPVNRIRRKLLAANGLATTPRSVPRAGKPRGGEDVGQKPAHAGNGDAH
jgi:transposase